MRINVRAVSPLRRDALRFAFPLATTLCTTITWAGDVNNPANDSLLAMSAQRQADILGKIVGEGCKGKTAFYQGTMKDIPQPKGDRQCMGHNYSPEHVGYDQKRHWRGE
jgi:hypothetical protein